MALIKQHRFLLIILCLFLFSSHTVPQKADDSPNIILIMADDMGYECIGTYGSVDYQTPVLDSLAANGIKFQNCVSQPLCTPSRVKIMTGLYNYRNYEHFGYLNPNQYTFGNLMKEAGYATCIAGKWQLNGLSNKDVVPTWNDKQSPNKFGFDEYCLWQLTQRPVKPHTGERYAMPTIEQNGTVINASIDQYGPDMFSDFILDFIEKKQNEKFFIYYPMVLVHDPFVPTPDSKDWENPEKRFNKDTAYFKDMVAYTDKIVGKITAKLKALNIDKNTIVIFTGDNGTSPNILTKTSNGAIRGAKGNTIDAGTHVPLIVYWPAKMKEPKVFNDLVEFSDFFPTFAEIVGKKTNTDGKSFFKLLNGEKQSPRATAFVHYDPRWSTNVDRYRNRFVRNLGYKLYQDGKFYNLAKDTLEKHPLVHNALSSAEIKIKMQLQLEMKKHPAWPTNAPLKQSSSEE